jgi:hypothetical protein
MLGDLLGSLAALAEAAVMTLTGLRAAEHGLASWQSQPRGLGGCIGVPEICQKLRYM